MPRWGMSIDLDKCTGCGACVIACRAENNIPPAGEEQTSLGRAIFWMELVPLAEEHPGARARFIPMPCMHCDNPPCIKVCPVGATYKNKEGVVAQIYAQCIGCRYCTTACAYTRRFFNWYEPRWPQGMEKALNPEVSARPKGVVEKCTFCIQRIRRAKWKAREQGRPLRDGDVLPACAESCPAGAILFGDLDDPESSVARLAKSPRAFRLLEHLGTRPKVFYLSEGRWDERR